MGSGERLIKRYDNRKLYDPAARRYVTLEDLARAVAGGEDIKVQERKTGEDITSVVLAQILLEGLKERTATIPRQVLVRLIRLGAGGAGAEWAPHELGTRAKEEAERIAGGLITRGRLSLDEALALRQEITGSVHRLVTETREGIEGRVKGLLDRSEREGVAPSLEALRHKLGSLESWLGPQGDTAQVAGGRPARPKRTANSPQRRSK